MGVVYTNYFQKSKVFLYPLLQLKKGLSYVPKQTYVAMEHVYSVENYKFLCEYNVKMSISFTKFCDNQLKNHPKFEQYINMGNDKHVFIFDFSAFKSDFKKFLNGKYSKFSLQSKIIILNFFKDGQSSDYIEAFLTPSNFHEDYASNFDVDIKIIEEVHELCSSPEIIRETLSQEKNKLIDLLKKTNVSLHEKITKNLNKL